MRDGEINYSKYTLLELEEGLASINKQQYPKNYANLRSSYERLKEATGEAFQPTPSVTVDNAVGRESDTIVWKELTQELGPMEGLAKRIALCILFVPFALVAIWLDAPWWSVSLLIGVFLFACCASWEDDLISFKVAAVALGLFLVLGVAAYLVATSIGVSVGKLTQDHSLSKYIRRLPEYSLSCLSFSVSAGISSLIRRWQERGVGA